MSSEREVIPRSPPSLSLSLFEGESATVRRTFLQMDSPAVCSADNKTLIHCCWHVTNSFTSLTKGISQPPLVCFLIDNELHTEQWKHTKKDGEKKMEKQYKAQVLQNGDSGNHIQKNFNLQGEKRSNELYINSRIQCRQAVFGQWCFGSVLQHIGFEMKKWPWDLK